MAKAQRVPITEAQFPRSLPKPPAFQTIGEFADRFGYKVRPGIDPSMRIDVLPRRIDPRILFIMENK